MRTTPDIMEWTIKQVDSNNDTVLQETSKDKEDEPGKTEESSAALKASDDVPSESVIDKSNESSKSTAVDSSKDQDGTKPLSEEEKEKETIKPTAEQSSAEKDDKKRPADKPVEKLIIKSSKLLTEKSQDNMAKDKPASNESVYDATTGKYGIWVDGEFVIDANKRHEDETVICRKSTQVDSNKSQDNKAKDKPASNEFVIDANKRHEDVC